MFEHSLAVRTTLARDELEASTIEDAKRRTMEAAFAVLARDIERGKLNLDRHIDLEDAAGNILYTVRLRDLLQGSGMAN